MESGKQTDGTATLKAPIITTIPETITLPNEQPAILQSTSPRAERRKTSNNLYDKVGRTGAYIGVTIIGILLWYVGAFYTLAAIRSFGIATNGIFWWFVPLLITMIELWLMPKKSLDWRLLAAFLFVLILDIGTSWQGLTSFAGKTLPLFGGIKLPTGGAELHVTAAIIAVTLAFIPEKIARAGVIELKKVWW